MPQRLLRAVRNRLQDAPEGSRLAALSATLGLLEAKLRSGKFQGFSGKVLFARRLVLYALEKLGCLTFVFGVLYRVDRVAFALLRAALPPSSGRRQAKYLLIQPNGLGDAVLNKPCTDLLEARTGQRPQDVVILASHAWQGFRDVLHPHNQVLFFNQERFEISLRYRLRIYRLLSGFRFETALCNLRWKTPGVVQNLLAVAQAERKHLCLCHAKRTAANERLRLWSGIFQVACHDTNAEPNELARIPLAYSLMFGDPAFRLPRRAQVAPPARARGFRRELGPYVVFHLGNAETARRWSLDKYIEVAQFLKAHGHEAAFCGGPSEADIQDARLAGFRSFINALSAEDYAAMLAEASAVLSGDTGPAHLAIALGTPTAILLGGGHYGNYFPYPADMEPPVRKVEYVVRRMDCFHCDWDCTMTPTFACIHGISAGDAIAALRRLLDIP